MARARTRKKATRKSARPQDITRRPTRSVPEDWAPRITSAEQLDEALSRLPTSPGVYIMRSRKGEVIYVGKARSLRARVRQYFNGTDTRMFVPLLAKLVGDIETVVVSSNKEAMLLENNLIKEHRPRFNVKLRDDSNYLVLRLDPKGEWPRLELRRQIEHDGAYYFGPYHSARTARSTLRVVNRHFKLRTCTDFVLHSRKRPCLQYQIDRCPAPCVHDVSEGDYDEQVKDVALFLAGRHNELIKGLRSRMESAAAELNFEVAARVRDQLRALESATEGQRIVGTASLDQDTVGMYREGGSVEFVLLHVRQGKVLGSQAFSNRGLEHPDPEVLANFLAAYYDDAPFVPDEVVLPFALADDDAEPLEAWLRDRKGKKVSLVVPERGDRRKLIALANKNAASNFSTRRNRREDHDAALVRLRDRLQLSKLPRVIECYDVSHLQGSDTVASMVVFVDGAADKSRYRSFKIKGLSGDGEGKRQGALQNDDFASMYEVLGRRFKRALRKRDADEDDPWALPDLIVIDGGKGQLRQVLTVMQDMGVPTGTEGVDVVSLAKERKDAVAMTKEGLEKLKARKRSSSSPGAAYRDWTIDENDKRAYRVRPERVFIPGVKDAVALRAGSSERYLMERVRDEAHRFAITHHRKRRSKRAVRSVLDDIEGVGPAIKRNLVQHFGSVAAIREATIDELSAVKGIGKSLAERIRERVGR
ncbi:MAG: excinuclease ABC subunit UvrC [Nannocystaceae bacterium]|nr:excinuclease ABC subunit UvrC [bacterium]